MQTVFPVPVHHRRHCDQRGIPSTLAKKDTSPSRLVCITVITKNGRFDEIQMPSIPTTDYTSTGWYVGATEEEQ
jgi:hypothetical protein